MKRYEDIVQEALSAELEALIKEIIEDPMKREVFLAMLDEDAGVANTASAPGLAGVSTGEPPPVPATQGGFPILRRKKPRRTL